MFIYIYNQYCPLSMYPFNIEFFNTTNVFIIVYLIDIAQTYLFSGEDVCNMHYVDKCMCT